MASIYGAYSKQSRLRLDYSYTQDITNNTTTFTLALYAEKPSGMGTHTYGYHDSTYTLTGKSGNQLINGTGDWTWGNTTEFKIAESTYTYNHNADGTGSCTLSGSWNTGLSSSSVVGSSMSVSGKVTLPTIPRASTPSVSGSMNMGTEYTISISRASTSFTHTLTYKFGSASGTIATGAGASAKWTPPLTLANQIPNASSGTGTITCQTYNGTTLIGTKTCSFTAALPSSYVPSFTSITATRVDNVVPSSWGIYVRTKSKCTLKINGAAGIYGSTIKSYSISGGGYSSTASSFTTGTLNTAGTNTFTAKITDSRGRTATKTVSITVVDYTAPVINSSSSQRCNSSGTVTDEGTYLRALATRTFASCSSKNTATLTVAYKKVSESSYGTATTLTSGTASVIGAGAIDANYTYDVKYTLTDAFGSVVKYEQVGPSFSTMDFKLGGKGIAFGKASETDNLFECDFPAQFNKNVLFATKRINKSLSAAGWYRIARCTYNQGARAGAFIGNLFTMYNNTNNSAYTLSINWVYKSARIQQLNGIENSTNLITQVRVVNDSADSYLYLEIYYNASVSNVIFFEINTQDDKVEVVNFTSTTSTSTALTTLTLQPGVYLTGQFRYTPFDISENANLNNLTSVGWYRCAAIATAKTLSNCPTTDAFSLEVTQHAGIHQRLVTYVVNSFLIYERNYYNGTWGTWDIIGSTKKMVVRPSARTAITSTAWTEAKINCATLSSNSSNGLLTQSGGGIKIGANVSAIKVQGSMSYYNYNTTGEVDLMIFKNTTKVAQVFGCCAIANQLHTLTTNAIAFNVVEGDVIYLYLTKGTDNSLTPLHDDCATSLSVEVMK